MACHYLEKYMLCCLIEFFTNRYFNFIKTLNYLANYILKMVKWWWVVRKTLNVSENG